MNEVKLDHYKCSDCGTRYPDPRKDCFYCGKSDTIRFEKIKKVRKEKKPYYGATVNIRLR